ncbi:MAG: hypothetical protein ACPLKQ_00980 [Candidatus Bathyarchaeales archaeon]
MEDLNENGDFEKQGGKDAVLLLLCYLAFAVIGYFIANYVGF